MELGGALLWELRLSPAGYYHSRMGGIPEEALVLDLRGLVAFASLSRQNTPPLAPSDK